MIWEHFLPSKLTLNFRTPSSLHPWRSCPTFPEIICHLHRGYYSVLKIIERWTLKLCPLLEMVFSSHDAGPTASQARQVCVELGLSCISGFHLFTTLFQSMSFIIEPFQKRTEYWNGILSYVEEFVSTLTILGARKGDTEPVFRSACCLTHYWVLLRNCGNSLVNFFC